MDCGVGWKLGSQGGDVVGLGTRGMVAWIWVVAVGYRDMWRITCECLDLHLARIRDMLKGFSRRAIRLRGISFS